MNLPLQLILITWLIFSSAVSHASAKFSAPKSAGPVMDKWWPMCVFDGTGGKTNPQIKEMVRMAAVECGVHLDILAYPIPPGADGGDPKAFVQAAKAKCNLTYGFRVWGANRGSILTILGNQSTARKMCSAQGAKDRNFCGELGFDPGESIKLKMANTGYYGGVAKTNEAAVSVVSGDAINARDMSAAALGQGMMALPQGFGAGNGIGTEFEGQLAGGRGVGSGWTKYGCQKMREAAFDNPRKNMRYDPRVEEWLPSQGKIVYLDVYDKARPIFGKPAQNDPNAKPEKLTGGMANPPPPPAKPIKPEPVPGGVATFGGSEGSFRGSSTDSARASIGSAAPTGHPQRGDSQVVSLRQSDGGDVSVPRSSPRVDAQQSAGRVSYKEDAEIDKKYLAELGADAPASTYAGGESSLAKISASADAAYQAVKSASSSGGAVAAGATSTNGAPTSVDSQSTSGATTNATGFNTGGATTNADAPGISAVSAKSAEINSYSAGTTAGGPVTGGGSNSDKGGESSMDRSPASSPQGGSSMSEFMASIEETQRKKKAELNEAGSRRPSVDYYGGATQGGRRSGSSDGSVTRVRERR